MNNHLQACPYCPKYRVGRDGCTVYADTSWVNRRGGCPEYPGRDLTGLHGLHKVRAGQQKQKHEDKKYRSKNDGKRKYKLNV
jgi:hypothetical protein